MFRDSCRETASRGFTLIEIIVSVAIFAVVMTIATGSVLAIIDANKKSRAIQAVVDNMNFALEEMSRQIRIGTRYHCGSQGNPGEPVGDLKQARDCAGGGNYIAFLSSTADTIEYRLNGQRIEKALNEGGFESLTAPDIRADILRFYVRGTPESDNKQAQVIIVIRGTVSTDIGEDADFSVQTTVTQRLLDS